MVDSLHTPVKAERGQRLFLAVTEGDGRTPQCDSKTWRAKTDMGDDISKCTMVRFKNRWFLVEFISVSTVSALPEPALFDGKHVYAALRQSVLSNFGDAGWGAVANSMTVKYFSPTTHLCIIRVARDQHTLAWGALTLLTFVNGSRVIPHIVHVSGTIKHVQLAAIKHNRQVVARFRAILKTPEQYQVQDSYETYLTQTAREIEALQE